MLTYDGDLLQKWLWHQGCACSPSTKDKRILGSYYSQQIINAIFLWKQNAKVKEKLTFSFPGVKKVSVLILEQSPWEFRAMSHDIFINPYYIHLFIKYFLTCYDVPDVCCLLGCRGQFSLIWPILWLTGNTCGKESTCQCRRQKRHGFYPWVGKIPWRKAWQPTPVFLPGESHGQKAWRATVHSAAKSWTQLRRQHAHIGLQCSSNLKTVAQKGVFWACSEKVQLFKRNWWFLLWQQI